MTAIANQIDASATLAELVTSTSFQDISATAIKAARLDLLDTLACTIAGRRAMGVPEITDYVLNQGGTEHSAVWGTGHRVPPAAAAFVNGTAGHALDYDDKHPAITHTGVTVIPPALASAQARGVSDLRDVLTAIVLGIEVADRMAHAVVDGPGVTGWLLTPLVGYFGSAAATAKIYGLDTLAVRHALGFAYIQTSGNGQSTLDGALGKRMQAGFAARGGVFAADLAAAGLTAPLNALEGARGFYHVYHRDRYQPESLRRSVEQMWLVEEATYKPFPCCGWTHAALEGGMQLAADGITAEEIERIEVGVNAQAFASVGTALPHRYTPKTPVDAQFSIPYTLATAFTTGNVTLADFTDDALAEPTRIALAAKVTVGIDEEIEQKWGRGVSPSRVLAHLTDGRVVEKFVLDPLGELSRPMTESDLVTKFHTCADYAGMVRNTADRIIDLALNGCGVGSATELNNLLELKV